MVEYLLLFSNTAAGYYGCGGKTPYKEIMKLIAVVGIMLL